MKAFYNDYEQLKENMAACNKSFDLELIDKAYELGVSDFICKPFDTLMVKQRVAHTIGNYEKPERNWSFA